MKKVDQNGKTPLGMPASVEAVFRSYPSTVRARLLRLRKIVCDTAAKMNGVGALEETLKWGQPAYLSRGGSTIRIDRVKDDPARSA